MIDNQTRHTLNLFQAALPHVNTRTRTSLELAIKAGELVDTFQSIQDPNSLSACDLDQEPLDMEALLTDLSKVSTPKEQETLNLLLNFLKAQALFRSYQQFQKSGGASEKAVREQTGVFSGASSQSPLNFLLSQLTPEQKSTVSHMLQLMNQP